MQKLLQYFRESRQELNHVKWPTKNQLIELTAIVLGVTLVVAAFTGALDYLFKEGFSLLVNLSGR